MGLPGPRGQSQREALILAARRAIDAPDLNGINLKAPEWDSRRPELDQLLAAGTALAFIRSEFGRYLTPEAWDQDAAEVKEVLAEAAVPGSYPASTARPAAPFHRCAYRRCHPI